MGVVNDELLTQAQAADLLGPHAASLYACVNNAWSRWLKNPDAPTASKTTRANTVYDYITQEVERSFADVVGVKLTWKHRSLHMTVNDAAVIKFKKFRSRRLRTSGITTNARKMFLRQDDAFDGMIVTHMVVGYLLDDLELNPAKIAVTCPLGTDNLWALDLGPGFETEAAIPTPLAPESPDQGGTIIRSTKVVASSDDAAVNEE